MRYEPAFNASVYTAGVRYGIVRCDPRWNLDNRANPAGAPRAAGEHSARRAHAALTTNVSYIRLGRLIFAAESQELRIRIGRVFAPIDATHCQ